MREAAPIGMRYLARRLIRTVTAPEALPIVGLPNIDATPENRAGANVEDEDSGMQASTKCCNRQSSGR